MSGITIDGGSTFSTTTSTDIRTTMTTSVNGNVYVSNVSPKIGNGSGAFGGATSISANSGNLLMNATSGRTVEFWIKSSSAAVQVYISMGNFGNSSANSWWQLYTQSNNRLEIGVPGSALSVTPANSWYSNGNLAHTFTRGNVYWTTSSNVMAIGAQNPTTAGLVGNMDEFRLSSNVRYTANFTPSTTAFTNDANTVLLLHMDGANGSTTFSDDNSGSVTNLSGITITL